MKKQVVVIHGGDTFGTHEEYLNFLRDFELDITRYTSDKEDWKKPLRQKLGDGYEVIMPVMPNKSNAQFEEWKLWMDKIVPFLNDGVILIGHSLGGIFLAKYLSVVPFSKKIGGVFLVAAPYEMDSDGYGVCSFSLPEKLNMQTKNIYLYHSTDDPVVPFSELEKYLTALNDAKPRILENRQHINQQEFPELIEDIVGLN